MGRRPPVVGVGGTAATGVPKGHRSKAWPEEGNPTLHLQPELGEPTKDLKGAERGSGLLAKARKGLQHSHRRGQKIRLPYGGFNKWRFDIAHDKASALMSSSSSQASHQWRQSRRWGCQPRPQLVILLLGTGAQTLCVLHQLFMDTKKLRGLSQVPKAS